MKLINISKIGYNHPSGANWSYGIWKIDLIDTDKPYQMSYTARETFGGDERLKSKLTELGIKHTESKATIECPKITGTAKMLDIESDEMLNNIKDWFFQS
jgi:hypothetical protein